jgi:hypothetical protein
MTPYASCITGPTLVLRAVFNPADGAYPPGSGHNLHAGESCQIRRTDRAYVMAKFNDGAWLLVRPVDLEVCDDD